MSTIVVVQTQLLNQLGYLQPELPSGVWFSSGKVDGDASAGETTIQHEFKGASAPAGQQFYSIEQVWVDIEDAVSREIAYIGILIGGTFPFDFRAALQSVAVSPTRSILTAGSIDAFRGIILGELTRQTQTAATMNVSIANPGAGVGFRSNLSGYFWGPEAKSAPGGPQRPAGGLFRQ